MIHAIFCKKLNSNLSFAKVRKNILFSKFLANYLNIRVYFMVLFAEKSQKMVLLVKKDRIFNSLQVKR
ncbi:hypothetical protein DXC61_13695 [Segatella copri]|uniref:Uncharacterized protein n=1 Tax=Segatella copri TaxID=165179 RepID=A0AA93B7X4_9BACT|nr:hypothetical protein DXC61_13695 [Segatella copri]